MPNSKTTKENNNKKIDFKSIENLLKINILDSDLFNILSQTHMKNEKQINNFNEKLLGGDNFTNLVENMKLKKVIISNFKSIKYETFELNEATVLSGKNSAGKSSFTHAILLLAQWLGGYADARPGYMPLNGEFIKLGNSKDIYFSEVNEEHANGEPTFKSTEPIKISLVFAEYDNFEKDREYLITFSFLPIFKKLNKSETKTLKYIQPNKKSYTITNQGNVKIIPNPELELISFSSKLIFKKDKFKQIFIQDQYRSIRTFGSGNKPENEIQSYIQDGYRNRRIINENFDNDILEFNFEFKKFSIDNEKFNAKNFVGSYLTNFVNSHKFTFGTSDTGTMNLILKSTKFGDKIERKYLISPYGLNIGGLRLPDGITRPTFHEYYIDEYLNEDYKNSLDDGMISKKEKEKIERYIKETGNRLSLQRIVPGNSFAVNGEQLVKIRLLTEVINAINSSDSPLIKEFIDKNYKKKYDNGSLLDSQKQKNKINTYKTVLKAIKNKSSVTINDKFLKDAYHEKGVEPFVWFLNYFNKENTELKNFRSRRRYFEQPNLIFDPYPESNNVEKLFDRLNKSNNRAHVRKLYNNINQDEMIDVLFKDSENKQFSNYRERLRRQNSDEFTQLVKISDFLEEISENIFFDFKKLRTDYKQSLLSFINKNFEPNFLKFFTKELIGFNLGFEEKLDSLINITSFESKSLWNELRQFNEISTNSIPEYSETINSHLIKESVANIIKKFLSDNQLENLNSINILKLGLPYITQDLFKEFLLMLGNETLDIISLLDKEKFEINETWDFDMLKTGSSFEEAPIMAPGNENIYRVGKLKKDDSVFVSLDKDMYSFNQEPKQKINIPIEIKTVSFLSGVLSRNSSDNRSIVSSFTPIGFHGGKLATELYNNMSESVSAPSPEMISIFENDHSRSSFLDENKIFNFRGLNRHSNENENFSINRPLNWHINQWINYLNLGKFISVSQDNKLGSSSITINSEGRGLAGSRNEELYNLGSGVSQALPIIAHILLSENKTIFLEEIEQNLHASAQATLADMILLFSLDKSRNFVIETHSEHIINRLRLRTLQLSKGKFPYQDKNPFNIFFAIKKKNGTKLTKMRIGESGNFIDEYPDGFFDQAQLDILRIISESE